jgi:tetratricopeptide (TPR) repeat protein
MASRLSASASFPAEIVVHFHPPNGKAIVSSSAGQCKWNNNSRRSHAFKIDNFSWYHQNLNHLNRLLLANRALQLALLVFLILSFSYSVAQIAEAGNPNLPPVPAGAQATSERYAVSTRMLGIPARARKHLAAAHKEFSKMNVDEALKQIDAALHTDPACAPAFSMRAFIRLAENDPGGAVEDAGHAIALDPADPESFIALAMSYNSLKEFQKAEEAGGFSGAPAPSGLPVDEKVAYEHLQFVSKGNRLWVPDGAATAPSSELRTHPSASLITTLAATS